MNNKLTKLYKKLLNFIVICSLTTHIYSFKKVKNLALNFVALQ